MIKIQRYLKHCIRDTVSAILYLFMMWTDRRGEVTLVYHSIGSVNSPKDPYKINLSSEKFEKHLEIISGCKERVKITFDDGFGNNFENAFPLLQKYGCTATVFLITDFIDGRVGSKEFSGADEELRPLTWEEIKTMDNAGIAFGSHSKTHPVLATLSREAIWTELFESKRRIETALNHDIDTFAYPFGGRNAFNETVSEVVKETGYRYAYTNIMGINEDGRKDDIALKRVRIYSDDGPFKLKMKLKGAYDWVEAFFRRQERSFDDRAAFNFRILRYR